jgi:prepilin-type N-terminal cleavage/methylation domain-containing protein
MSVSYHTKLGFTLVEIMLVLALLGLIGTMMPLVLDKLYSKSKHQTLVQAALAAVQKCSINAQQYQRSLALGSSLCPLSNSLKNALEADSMPVFNADGTASKTFYLRLVNTELEDARAVEITVDKLTARATVQTYVPVQ